MSDHDQQPTEAYFPKELSREAKRVATVRDEFGDDVDFRELLEAQLEDVEEWARHERKYGRRLYAKVQAVYAIYVLASGHLKRETLVQRRCDSAGITETRASHLSIRLVKLLLRPAEKTTYQYAAALRYAALKKIPVDDLAAALEKDGGIANFAERFWQKASKLASDRADHGENSDEASGEDSGNGKDRDGKRRAHDQSAEALPEFEWNKEALNVYAEAGQGDRVKQIAKKSASGHWVVIKARLVA